MGEAREERHGWTVDGVSRDEDVADVHPAVLEVYDTFEDSVLERFAYLREYGYLLAKVTTSGVDYKTMWFQNGVAAVQARVEPWENFIGFWIVKMSGRFVKRIPRPLSITAENSVGLDELAVARRGAPVIENADYDEWITPAAVRRIVMKAAPAMRALADDLLRGDFSFLTSGDTR